MSERGVSVLAEELEGAWTRVYGWGSSVADQRLLAGNFMVSTY